MFFKRGKKEVKKTAKKMDSIVTWLIVGGAVASIFGLSKTKKWRKVGSRVFRTSKKTLRVGYSVFGRVMADTISFITNKK